jgi:hypothetical protein
MSGRRDRVPDLRLPEPNKERQGYLVVRQLGR